MSVCMHVCMDFSLSLLKWLLFQLNAMASPLFPRLCWLEQFSCLYVFILGKEDRSASQEIRATQSLEMSLTEDALHPFKGQTHS